MQFSFGINIICSQVLKQRTIENDSESESAWPFVLPPVKSYMYGGSLGSPQTLFYQKEPHAGLYFTGWNLEGVA